MIESHERVVVGVSGGADSVCLLFLLCRLSKELDFSLNVVHVNHMLRETAARDEEFVSELCSKWQVPCFVEHIQVDELAKREGLTVEEAGRQARFSAFAEWKEKLSADKIALAHHRDDQAETVLFHLGRGCGIEGLVGIRPVRDDIIHPLLCVGRDEIEAFLQKEGLSYMTDETNEETIYARNVLRHKVMPVLRQEICSEATGHIAKTAEICFEAADFLRQQTKAVCESVIKKQTDQAGRTVVFLSDDLLLRHLYLQKSVIHEALELAAGKRKDISSVHIETVLSLWTKQVGKSCNLPYGLTGERTYGGVRLCHSPLERDGISQEEQFSLPELFLSAEETEKSYILPNDKILSIRVFPYEKTDTIPQKTYTKWFDYDKIDGHLTLRTRQTGDYFYLDDTKRQTLKAYMINNKIPKEERDRILLVAENDHVLWLAGYRISSFYKVSESTNRILEITIRGGEDNG